MPTRDEAVLGGQGWFDVQPCASASRMGKLAAGMTTENASARMLTSFVFMSLLEEGDKA
jgi:hypothetical protein